MIIQKHGGVCGKNSWTEQQAPRENAGYNATGSYKSLCAVPYLSGNICLGY